MSYEKIARVVKALSEQSNTKKITWAATTQDGVYMVSFPNQSVLISKKTYEDEWGRDITVYSIKIINENGEIIEEVDNGDLANHLQNSLKTMEDMYEYARRQAMGVEDALDEILDIIDPNIPF